MDGSRHRIRHSGESRNPEGEGGTNHTQTLPPTNASNFHTLVCRRQPAWAIGTKACPGLRPGMDGSRHRIRHSGESRNPGGRVAPTTPKHFQRPGLIFIPWCAGASRHERLVRKHVPDSDPGWIPAPAGDTNHRRPNNDSRGPKERCSAGAGPLPAGSGGRPATVTTAPTSSFRRRPESRGGIGGRHQFSYLSVPAATGAGDSYGTLPRLD